MTAPAWGMMTTERLYAELTERFPARRTARQKAAFSDWFSDAVRGLGIQVAELSRAGSRNLLCGDLSSARLVVCAHYDTPRRNVLNVPMYYDHPRRKALRYLPAELVCALAAWRSNPNNHNDNTSGVLGVYEVLARGLPGVAGVLFDNEEKGDLGSNLYYRKRKDMREVPHVNLDCIGVGEAFVVLYNRGCDTLGKDLAACAPEVLGKVAAERDSAAAYYSDNKALNVAVTVAGFKRDRRGLRYNDDIHTARDTVLELDKVYAVADMIQAYCSHLS